MVAFSSRAEKAVAAQSASVRTSLVSMVAMESGSARTQRGSARPWAGCNLLDRGSVAIKDHAALELATKRQSGWCSRALTD